MVTIKVGRRGQITITREIRRILGLREGDTIALIPQGDQAILRPITETLLALRGSEPVDAVQEFEAIRRQVVAERAGKTGSYER
jgi:AbrB family looped-hinge helix DNA binding protein